MNEDPAILIVYDRQTWQPKEVFFKSSTDEETKRLQEILREGLKTIAGGSFDA